MSTVFDRYIGREFLRVLAITLAGFVFVYLLVDIFDNIDTFIDRDAPLDRVVLYYVNLCPYIIILTLPMSTLLASMLAVGSLARNNELVAMKTSGVSLYRLLLPLWAIGILLSLLVVLGGGWLLPETNARARRIRRFEIEHRPALGTEPERSLVHQSDGLIYHLGVLYPERGVAERMGVVAEKDGVVAWRLDAGNAQFRDGSWNWGHGYLRVFTPIREHVAPFVTFRSTGLSASPEELLRKPRQPEELGVADLRRLIRTLSRSGLPTAKQQVELHIRFSFPLANLLMVLIGAPLASTPRRSGLALSFGISIAISFAFFGSVRACQAMGHHQSLPPVVAAWLPDIVFLAAGLVVLAKVRK
ncbi:LptF/LptG family permease [Candidatus Fermentibacteria bacterium]|nr:LptF/LptG family permease [Candidatus Fermentibacteria bacterium]